MSGNLRLGFEGPAFAWKKAMFQITGICSSYQFGLSDGVSMMPLYMRPVRASALVETGSASTFFVYCLLNDPEIAHGS